MSFGKITEGGPVPLIEHLIPLAGFKSSRSSSHPNISRERITGIDFLLRKFKGTQNLLFISFPNLLFISLPKFFISLMLVGRLKVTILTILTASHVFCDLFNCRLKNEINYISLTSD